MKKSTSPIECRFRQRCSVEISVSMSRRTTLVVGQTVTLGHIKYISLEMRTSILLCARIFALTII